MRKNSKLAKAMRLEAKARKLWNKRLLSGAIEYRIADLLWEQARQIRAEITT